MISGKARSREEATFGRGKMRATGAIALTLLFALGVCAPAASAEPLSMTFTEDRANVGVQLSDSAMFEPPKTAPFTAQIDSGSGSITGGVLDVPQFATHITEPIVADVTVDFDIGIITGSFNQATGALTLEGEAGGTLTAKSGAFDGEECTVSTTPQVLALSTAGNSGGSSPRSGAPFSAGLTGAGAIAGQWASMEAAPVNSGDPENVNFCNNVETRIEGAGGIWLRQEGDVVSPSAPQLTSTDPASPGSSGTPRIRGAAEAKSTVRLYAGPGCAGTPLATASAAELGAPGIRVEVAEGVTAAFSATATDAAGNTSACSAPISYTHTPACVVPNVVGKKLKAAKRKIRAAGCKVGKVRKPKRHRGKRHRVLVVKSSNPAAGASPASGKVNLRLGPKS